MTFESVVFNAGEKYYRVYRDGNMSTYEQDDSLDLESMCLLDPCELVDKQSRLWFGLTMISSSPSQFTKRQNQYSLSDFQSYKVVMKAWTESEIRAVCPQVAQQRFLDFCMFIVKESGSAIQGGY